MRPDLDLRGYLDTRAAALTLGISLLAIAAIAVAAGLLQPGVVETGTSDVALTLSAVALPLMIVLPVLAVALTAGDWSDRSIQHTLLHRPGRFRVMISKVVAAVVLCAGAIAMAVGSAVLSTWIGGELMGEGAVFAMDASQIGIALAQMGSIALFAIAMGLLTQSLVLGLIAAIGFPVVVSMASGIAMAVGSETLTQVVRAVDLTSASVALAEGGGEAFDLVPILLLVLLPGALGAWRWARREVG